MGCPVVHWELCEDVEAEFAAGGRVAECLSSRASVSVPCHPERAFQYPVIPSERLVTA